MRLKEVNDGLDFPAQKVGRGCTQHTSLPEHAEFVQKLTELLDGSRFVAQRQRLLGNI